MAGKDEVMAPAGKLVLHLVFPNKQSKRLNVGDISVQAKRQRKC